VYSFSSNETILEVYSSSPPTSTEPAEHDANSTWKLSTNDSIALSCNGASFARSHVSQARCRDTLSSSANPNGPQEDVYLIGVEGGERTDSEESVNWDEDSEEEEERQQRLAYRKEPTGQATFPQTMGFWFDAWIAQVGARAVNVSSRYPIIDPPGTDMVIGRLASLMREYPVVESED
jgi:hypothetical protein